MWTLLRLNPLPNDTRSTTSFLILGMSSRPLPTLPDLRCDRDGIARKLGDTNQFKAGENVVWCKENPICKVLSHLQMHILEFYPFHDLELPTCKLNQAWIKSPGGEILQ